jgi:hypothetical protein
MVVTLVRGSLLAGLAVKGVVPRTGLTRSVLVTVDLTVLLVPARRAVLASAGCGLQGTLVTGLGADIASGGTGSLLRIVALLVSKDDWGGSI